MYVNILNVFLLFSRTNLPPTLLLRTRRPGRASISQLPRPLTTHLSIPMMCFLLLSPPLSLPPTPSVGLSPFCLPCSLLSPPSSFSSFHPLSRVLTLTHIPLNDTCINSYISSTSPFLQLLHIQFCTITARSRAMRPPKHDPAKPHRPLCHSGGPH